MKKFRLIVLNCIVRFLNCVKRFVCWVVCLSVFLWCVRLMIVNRYVIKILFVRCFGFVLCI